MKIPRFYCPDLSAETAVLDPSESHHLQHVLRLTTDSIIEVFDGRGTTGIARIRRLTKNRVELQLESSQTHSPPSWQIILAVSVAKGHRFDGIVEKCTELGVDHLLPVIYERTVKHADSKHTVNRYQKIALSAAKQSGRTFLPEISPSAAFDECLQALLNRYPKALSIYGDFREDAPPLPELLKAPPPPITIFWIGPEGGFSEAEIQCLKEIGGHPACINRNILRIETAAAAFAAVWASFRIQQTANLLT